MTSTATAYLFSLRHRSDVAGFRVLQRQGWFRIPKDRLAWRALRIGRSDDCDFRIRHRTVSRCHCVLSMSIDGDVVIMDEQSKNGVQVARRGHYGEYDHVKWHILQVGDLIRMGNIRMIAVDQHGRCPIQINEGADFVRFAMQVYGNESQVCDMAGIPRSLWRQLCEFWNVEI